MFRFFSAVKESGRGGGVIEVLRERWAFILLINRRGIYYVCCWGQKMKKCREEKYGPDKKGNSGEFRGVCENLWGEMWS